MYCCYDCKLVQQLWKTVQRILKKLKIELLPCDPAIPLLGIYPKETKAQNGKGTYIPMFMATYLTIAKIGKQPKCPLMDEWIKKLWKKYTHTHTHTHTGILFSHKKMRKSYHLQQHGWSLKALC